MDGCVLGQNVYPGARPVGVAEQRKRERRGPGVQRKATREGKMEPALLCWTSGILWSLSIPAFKGVSPVCSIKITGKCQVARGSPTGPMG